MDLCCELPKLPNLITHYAEHQREDDDTFLQFLMEDYFDTDSAKNHHDEPGQEDLPFHSTHQCSHAHGYFSVVTKINLTPTNKNTEKPSANYKMGFSSPYPDTILQPPQV